ncbi:MAG TPA: L,D-transpeptidase [Pyrinomonadaceae bacterium]|nr:L,D-transpeptidase [Pyrinomonadaceae bacterium]
MTHSRTNNYSFLVILLTLLSLVAVTACQPATNSNSNTSPAATPSPRASPSASPNLTSNVITLPVLDALFSDEGFKTKLKSSVQLTDDQLAQLQKAAADEVARLREANTEDGSADQTELAARSRQNADALIRKIVGEEKSTAVQTFVHNYWVNGGEVAAGDKNDGMLPGPNAVPKDTRVVVNIPAYRMDVFREGTLVKSYKVGIGYPDFPLPTGLRKAQTIIINPTWTPPDEPWVAKMKGVEVGEKVAAGSKLNPLGPVKIPIGLPSLIHGGKSPAKLGTFASHGCVGLTSPQVLDFSKLLAQVGGAELADKQLQAYLKEKTKTETVKLGQAVPVELRYETIVVEDGKLHIYRDVYAHATNTEENLRAVLAANGIQFDSLTPEEQSQIRDALVAIGGTASSTATPPKAEPSPEAKSKTSDKKTTAASKKPVGKNQKEVVIELASLKGKGYPTAVNLDTGSGKPAALVAAVR